jgi:hypothetical protein
MSRASVAGVVTGAAALASGVLLACSLAVSTSGLSDGASPSSPDGGEAGAVDAADAASAPADGATDASRDPNLVAEYSFEDPIAGGTARDTSGNERHGLLQEGATFAVDGVRGRALSVSGGGFFVVGALAGAMFPRSGTISVWFRFASTSAVDTQASIFDSFDTDRSHIMIRHANGAPADEFQFALQKPATQYVAVTEITLEAGAWHHLVVTWDEAKGEAAFYARGALLKRSAYAEAFAPEGQLFRLGERLKGGIDEVRLYDRALSEAEALKLD